MVALGDVAQTRPRGSRADSVGIDSAVENRSWAVWSSAHSRALQRGFARSGPEKFGMQALTGREIDVNMKKVVLDLWPALRQRGAQGTETFVREIYEFLRASQNAACIRVPGLNAEAGASAGPRWWVSDTWNDTKAVKTTRFVETPTERRLSKKEAGEDRPPAPVTVTKRRPLDELETKILDAIKNSPYPVTVQEICAVTGSHTTTVRMAAAKLLDDKLLWRRLQTSTERQFSGGRKAYLYWNAEPVPLRDPDTFAPTPSENPGVWKPEYKNSVRPLMERINQLKTGEMVAVGQATAAEKVEIKELVDAGLIVYVGGEERDVALAPPVSEAVPAPEVPAPPVNPPAPDPALPVATPAPADPASLLQAFVQQALDAERAGWIAERDRLTAERDEAQRQLNEVRSRLDNERADLRAAQSDLGELRTALRHLADGTRPGTGR